MRMKNVNSTKALGKNKIQQWGDYKREIGRD